MAISVDWGTKVVSIPKADLSLVQVSPEIRELDVAQLHLDLKDEEDSELGMACPDIHRHIAPVTVGGVTLGRVVEFINGYTVTFEDGAYAVNLTSANNNIGDVLNYNQVQVRAANSAGLVIAETGVSGLTAEESDQLERAVKAMVNRAVISPDDLEVTIYDDDQVTPFIEFDISADKRERTPK